MGTYSVIGLGKLGACMAAAIAARGNDVIGVDVNRSVVEDLASGRAPLTETNLQQTIGRAGHRLDATTSYADAVARSDVTFVVVPTPSDERGAFSIEYARAAFEELGSALADKDGYHLVVLSSTVLPGSSRYGLIPVLEAAARKEVGQDIGFCYSPEFIALGSVIHDFLNPDFLLIGEYDGRAGDLLQNCYDEIVENGAECKRMSIENAELAKVSLNSFVTMKITFANMLAQLCELMPGGDVDVVTDAIGSDRRVGRSYLKGGLGFGGPCFPRDNVALTFLAERLGVEADLPRATDAFNRRIPEHIVDRIAPHLSSQAKVAVVGVAYKPATAVVEESQGIAIATALAGRGFSVKVFDRLAQASARAELAGTGIDVTASLADALAGVELVVLTTPDRAVIDEAVHLAGDAMMVDCWRILSESHDELNVISLGQGSPDGNEVLSSLQSHSLA